MAHFQRTTPAPEKRAKKKYSVYRPDVRKDFKRCCAYCLRHEDWADGERTFEIDHFRPRVLFPELLCDFYNLYYSCHRCNNIKQENWPPEELISKGIGFVDFCQDDFDLHFEALADGKWKPLSDSARYTERILRLNDPHLVKRRYHIMKHKYEMGKPLPDDIQ